MSKNVSFLLTVKKITQETYNTKTFLFAPTPALTQYQPGQFITLHIPIRHEIFRRSYSLSTCPYTDPLPGITIKRVEGGTISNYLNDYLKEGDELEATPPQGNFTLPSAISERYQAVCIAGGSGITPIFAIIKTLLSQHRHSSVLLINVNRNEENIIYSKQLKRLKHKYKSRIEILHILSQPSALWQGKRGRLTQAILQEILHSSDKNLDRNYFLCGPQGLMNMSYQTLLENRIASKQHIYQEKFTLPYQQATSRKKESMLTIRYNKEVYTCSVEENQTLLDVALAHGIDIPFSCSSGMCNLCRAKCLKGKVSMLEDQGITQQELDEGYILTCVGYADSDEVFLEIEDA